MIIGHNSLEYVLGGQIHGSCLIWCGFNYHDLMRGIYSAQSVLGTSTAFVRHHPINGLRIEKIAHPPCLAYGFHQSRPAGTRVTSHPFKPIQNGTNKGRTQPWRVKLQSTNQKVGRAIAYTINMIPNLWDFCDVFGLVGILLLRKTRRICEKRESKSCALQRESSRYPTRAVGTGRSVIDGLNPRKTPRISGFPRKRLPVNEH